MVGIDTPTRFPDILSSVRLSKWELTISRWESSAHDALNEGVKIALLLKMTPEPLRQNLHLQGHTKYGVARAAVVNALVSTLLAEYTGANGSWRDWWQKASQG